ncbi:MAG: hypothetical protein HFJ48_01150 [Clostridia bacterium]|nr:hypothetical protein [Clostridia bacterium]
MDDVFYQRQLELAQKLTPIVGSEIKKIITTEYLYDYEMSAKEFMGMLSYSQIQMATRKKRINVTIVYKEMITHEAARKINKIMCCNYAIYGNQLWYSMKPERLDSYMRTEKA